MGTLFLVAIGSWASGDGADEQSQGRRGLAEGCRESQLVHSTEEETPLC